jgi:hypothetical protein
MGSFDHPVSSGREYASRRGRESCAGVERLNLTRDTSGGLWSSLATFLSPSSPLHISSITRALEGRDAVPPP